MKVSVKDGKNCQKILKVELEKERVLKEFDSCYKSLIPSAKIPGFRPGKAPINIVKMHYAGEAREQVMKNLLNDSYRDAILEKSIEPLGYPEIGDVQFTDEKLSYEATVEVRPKIKLTKYKGLSAKKQDVKVDKKEIEESLKRVQESQAKFIAVEKRAAKMGDYLIADYVCTVEGKEIDKRKGDMFELKEEEFLKGMSKQLVGVKSGENKEVKVKFQKDFAQKDLAGKEAIFQMQVKEIKEKILPAIDDDLAKDAGEFESIKDLRAKIEEDLRKQKSQAVDHAFEEALIEELLKKNSVDLPQRLVSKRVEYLSDQSKARFLQTGADESAFEVEMEKMLPDLKKEAEKQVHLAFLLDEISEKENITVNEEDMQAEIKAIADRFKQPQEVVEKYYTQHPDALESVKDQVQNKKTMDFIKNNAK